MKRRNLLIVCAGNQTCITADYAVRSGLYTDIAILAEAPVDSLETLKQAGYTILPPETTSMEYLKQNFDEVYVATGSNTIRLHQTRRFLAEGFAMPPIIHPEAYVHPSAQIGEGSYISPRAVIGPWAVIGQACLINTAVIVEHDCVVHDGVHISPNAAMGGHVEIGQRTWVCLSATLSNNITIGHDSVIAAGAVVIRNIPDHVLAAGVPAVIKKELPAAEM